MSEMIPFHFCGTRRIPILCSGGTIERTLVSSSSGKSAISLGAGSLIPSLSIAGRDWVSILHVAFDWVESPSELRVRVFRTRVNRCISNESGRRRLVGGDTLGVTSEAFQYKGKSRYCSWFRSSAVILCRKFSCLRVCVDLLVTNGTRFEPRVVASLPKALRQDKPLHVKCK
jgi:hypothetical protein